MLQGAVGSQDYKGPKIETRTRTMLHLGCMVATELEYVHAVCELGIVSHRVH